MSETGCVEPGCEAEMRGRKFYCAEHEQSNRACFNCQIPNCTVHTDTEYPLWLCDEHHLLAIASGWLKKPGLVQWEPETPEYPADEDCVL